MFNSLLYLKTGNEKQRRAYLTIHNLGVMKDLAEYNPTVCGTIPIDIDVKNSDLDIIMEVYDLDRFENRVTKLYKDQVNFRLKRTVIRDRKVVKANFFYNDFEFELFGQPQPVHKQNAYQHMIIEQAIMKEYPLIKKTVIKLKQKGCKTEHAFCEILGLVGDPYEQLLKFGRDKEFI